MSHGWFTCECGNHYHETEHPSGYCAACAKKEENMSLRDDMYEPEYPLLEKGDVAYISNTGYGFTENNRGLYCVIEEYNPTGYYGSAGYRVSKYEHDLVAHDYQRDWVGVKTFGESPLILFNINDEHTVDEGHVVVAEGSKQEVDKALGIKRDSFDSSLTKRKNGKNKMELVETGFPNAFLALGEVMTWAAEYKGYEPNDWKDIPDAKNALLAAAARHRTKRLAGQEYDEESNLPHLYHEAFNVMAQLELLITGKLK